MQNLKSNAGESIYKTETDSQTQKTNLWLPKGRREYGFNRLKTTLYTIDKQQEFTYYTANYFQYIIISYNQEKISESLCCTPETNTIL